MPETIRVIVETVIKNRSETTGRRYHGGAAARIIAQVPKDIRDKEQMIDAIDAAFQREEACYF